MIDTRAVLSICSSIQTMPQIPSRLVFTRVSFVLMLALVLLVGLRAADGDWFGVIVGLVLGSIILFADFRSNVKDR